MQPIADLLIKLKADYPHIVFIEGDDYRWLSGDRTLEYPRGEDNSFYLLHEIAHSVLKHNNFRLDVELLAQERAAWDLVRESLAAHYDTLYDSTAAEDALETYREWLHSRSLCPRCSQTGLQTKTSTYVCINCRCSWRPNDARRCALRRYKIA
jgi:hypothetical protein